MCSILVFQNSSSWVLRPQVKLRIWLIEKLITVYDMDYIFGQSKKNFMILKILKFNWQYNISFFVNHYTIYYF